MRRRDVLVVAGLGGFALAIVASFVPAVGGAVPFETVVDLAGNDYFVIALVGVLALAGTVAIAARRAASGVDQATPPDPEHVQRAPPLGAAFDRRLEEPLELPSLLVGSPRSAVRERLREAATRTVSSAEGTTREAAERAVEAGQWTDDSTAAMFLRRRPPTPPLEDRLHAALRGDTWFQHAARTTADAVASEAGIEPEDGSDRPSVGGAVATRGRQERSAGGLQSGPTGGRHV